MTPELSLVIPLRDEESNVLPLHAEFTAVFEAIGRPYEAILVEDGSVDQTFARLCEVQERDARVRIITNKSPEALPLYRHSTAHLLAAAVTQLFPGTQCGIGPATDEGFFYDFVVPRPFVPEDLEAIEQKMRELVQQDLPYERQMWPRDEAKRFFGSRSEPLKVQLIEEKTEGQSEVSCYTIKDKETFVDFCVGPHVPSTGKLKAFKLLSTSNAYWKGDARNQPMQRIYGTAFLSEKELQEYLRRLEEAKKRDHRKIGRELGLFWFHPWAPGEPFWLPKGTALVHLLGNYMRDVLFPAGYVEVRAPLVFNKALWETSGHWQHYRQNMFLVESEGVQGLVKVLAGARYGEILGVHIAGDGASECKAYRGDGIRIMTLHGKQPRAGGSAGHGRAGCQRRRPAGDARGSAGTAGRAAFRDRQCTDRGE